MKAKNEFLSYYFLVVAVLSLILYPTYSRWKYKRHYKKYVDETFKTLAGECTVEITNDFIMTKDKTGESKISTTEIEEINEISEFYFVKIKSGASLIISKVKTDVNDLQVIEKDLKEMADKTGIQWNVELDWRWR